jgi:hypothetical protein
MSLSPRRAGLVLAVVLVVVLVLAIPGRHERASANSQELRGIEGVASESAGKRPSEYRITTSFDCLLYPEGGEKPDPDDPGSKPGGPVDPYALELCFDAQGRAVLAVDRHERDDTRIWSIRYHPSLATIRFDPRSLFETFKSIKAIPADARFEGRLPLFSDLIVVKGSQGDSSPLPVGTRP